MGAIISNLRSQLKRPWTLQYLGAGILLLAVALIIGLDDNPAGILIAFASSILLFFAFVHHWRGAHQFGTLLAVSVISFPVLVLLHNIFDGLAGHLGPIPVLTQFLTGLSVISFFGAIFIAPAGILIGIFAGLFYLFKPKSTK